MQEKQCTKCLVFRPLSEFSPRSDRKNRPRAECRSCHSIRAQIVRKEVRDKIFVLLGHSCTRCGFDDKRALQVDHIAGGGNAEKRKLKGNGMVDRRVLQHPEDYQILCANCNWIKRAENKEFNHFGYISKRVCTL